MRNEFRDDNLHSSQAWVGWLFADMLLALAVFFLVANTVDLPNPPPPTPVPQRFIIPTTSPITSQRVIEQTYCLIMINVDNPQKFSEDFYFAVNELEPNLINQNILQGRQVGVVIVEAGAKNNTNNTNYTMATAIANQTYKALEYLGDKNIIFSNATYYEPIPNDGDLGTIYLEIYLVAQKGHGDTCDPETHQPL